MNNVVHLVGASIGIDYAQPGGDKTMVSLIIEGKLVWCGPSLSIVRHAKCDTILYFCIKPLMPKPGDRFPRFSDVIYPDGLAPRAGEKVRPCPACGEGEISGLKDVSIEILGEKEIVDTPTIPT